MRATRLNLCLVILAVLVPAVALLLSAGPERSAAGLAVAPFGWPRLVIVHLLATLPLGLLLATSLSRVVDNSPRARWFGRTSGFGLAWLTVATGADVAILLDDLQTGFTARLIARVLWCLALELPWCLGIAYVLGSRAWPRRAFALVVAVGLPAAFALSLIDVQTKKAEELLRGMRLARARHVVRGLADLGSPRPMGGSSPASMSLEIEGSLQTLAAELAQPLPAPVTPDVRIARARVLAVLDRRGEAARLLEDAVESDPEAALLRAAVLQDQERWEESSRCYRLALARLEEAPCTEAALAGRARAYDGLAFNARAKRRFLDAEAVYHEALRKIPEAKAHFHFQLGRHYQQGGRPMEAMHHFRTAGRLSPAQYGERARLALKEMTAHTPGCLLRWSFASAQPEA